MIFDDDRWGDTYLDESTILGIKKFLEEYDTKIDTIFHEYQVTIRKK